MVIDMLNMPVVTFDYQKQLYGEYSEEIQDYVDLVYKDPHGDEYTVSTRTYVSDNKKAFVQ